MSYSLKADDELVTKLDQISRFSYLLNAQPDMVRHTLYLENNIAAKITYTKSPNSDSEKLENIFYSTLLCDDNLIEADSKENKRERAIKKGLRLSDQENNDREYVENIIKNCLKSANVAFTNNLGYQIIVYPNEIELLPNNSIIMTIEPDLISVLVIYIGWLVFWIGFLILIREGPWKHLKRKNILFK